MDIKKLIEADKKVKGTQDYQKYKMVNEAKINNKWVFIGWGVPYWGNEEYKIKKVKNNTYLMVRDERYTLTEEVIKVLEL